MTTNRMGLTPDQSANCFSDDELEMMQHENNPRSHAFRELLAYRKASEEPVARYDNYKAVVEKFTEMNIGFPVIKFKADYVIGWCLKNIPIQSVTAPDGWKLVPIKPTENMVVEGFESEPDSFFSHSDEWEAYKAMSGCQQAAHKAKLCWAAMIAVAPSVTNEP